jgi:hypothetical protein
VADFETLLDVVYLVMQGISVNTVSLSSSSEFNNADVINQFQGSTLDINGESISETLKTDIKVSLQSSSIDSNSMATVVQMTVYGRKVLICTTTTEEFGVQCSTQGFSAKVTKADELQVIYKG